MSTAALERDERATDSTPRCSLEVARNPRKSFCGTVRAPRHPDERGAINVVELLMGGERLAFFRVAGQDLVDIRRLPPKE